MMSTVGASTGNLLEDQEQETYLINFRQLGHLLDYHH